MHRKWIFVDTNISQRAAKFVMSSMWQEQIILLEVVIEKMSFIFQNCLIQRRI